MAQDSIVILDPTYAQPGYFLEGYAGSILYSSTNENQQQPQGNSMATIIKIKRSANVTAPSTSTLVDSELAYSQDKANNGNGAVLYIRSLDNGNNPVIHKIGGKYYTDIIDAATSLATPDTLVMRDADGSFSANVITANSILGEAQSAAIATTANALTTGRYIQLVGDVDGEAYFDGTANAVITTTFDFGNVSVELGTNTNGDYVANVLAGTGLTATGQGGETANITINLADTAVTPGTYGGVTEIPVFTVDAQGRLTAASNATISTSFDITGDTGTDTVNTGDVLTFVGGTGIDTAVTDNTVTITNSGVVNLEGTANQITANAATGSIVLSIPNNFVAPGDVTVTGDLIVSGNTTTINTQTITTEDSLIKLANNNIVGDTVDIGFYGEYNNGNVSYAGLIRDASDGVFKLFKDITVDPSSNVLTYTAADRATIDANLTGGTISGLATAIAVADGGTGATSFSANSVLLGNGTSAVTAATGTEGQVVQIVGGIPVFADIDGGVY